MMEVHFYEEKVLIPLCDTLKTFHQVISEKFSLDPVDSSELIIYFICGAIKCYISGEDSFKMATSQLLDPKNKNTEMIFELEVSEMSRLFQTELANTKAYFANTFVIVENEKTKEKELQEKQELLNKEIQEKEKRHNEMLLKEKEKELERRELEKNDKILLEKARELAQQSAKEKEELTKSVSKAVIETLNSNLEKFKEQLIEKALQETSKAIEKSVLMKSTISKNEAIHKGYGCDACGMRPIVGNRYHCTICNNFDLCDSCEEQCTHPHGLIKYKTENMCPNLQCSQNRNFMKNILQTIKNLREQYDLSSFTDHQIKYALVKTYGNPDEALEMLFK